MPTSEVGDRQRDRSPPCQHDEQGDHRHEHDQAEPGVRFADPTLAMTTLTNAAPRQTRPAQRAAAASAREFAGRARWLGRPSDMTHPLPGPSASRSASGDYGIQRGSLCTPNPVPRCAPIVLDRARSDGVRLVRRQNSVGCTPSTGERCARAPTSSGDHAERGAAPPIRPSGAPPRRRASCRAPSTARRRSAGPPARAPARAPGSAA